MDEETRVRMSVKQTAKGAIQMDLTAEAPTVIRAGELLDEAIDKLLDIVSRKGLEMAG